MAKFSFFRERISASFAATPVTDKSVMPSENDFHYFKFRLLSATIVGNGGWNCTEFTEDVLRKAYKMWEGKPAYLEHYDHVRNTIGVTVNTEFDKGFVDAKTGLVIPAGINGEYKISAVTQSELVYNLNCMPSPIQSTSATVEFNYKPSMDFPDEWDFYMYLGDTITVDGVKHTVRMIATEIINCHENSPVSLGADPYAKRMYETEDGKRYLSQVETSNIVTSSRYSKTDDEWLDLLVKGGVLTKEKAAQFKQKFTDGNNKYHFMHSFSKEKEPEMPTTEKEPETTTQETTEKVEISADIQALQSELEAVRKENNDFKADFSKKVAAYAAEATTLKASITALQRQLDEQKHLVEFAKEATAKYRTHAKEVYTKSVAGKTQPNVIELIETTDIDKLEALVVSWGSQAMMLYGTPKCNKCGGAEFSIRTSEPDKSFQKQQIEEDDQDSLKNKYQ